LRHFNGENACEANVEGAIHEWVGNRHDSSRIKVDYDWHLEDALKRARDTGRTDWASEPR
jgi:hypothetical protein